jgi:hypothetical protein
MRIGFRCSLSISCLNHFVGSFVFLKEKSKNLKKKVQFETKFKIFKTVTKIKLIQNSNI